MKTAKQTFVKGLLLGTILTITVVVPLFVYAQSDNSIDDVKLNVPIPGIGDTITVNESTLGNYVRALYVWFVGVAGIIAVVMVMWAGVRWITAAGNTSRIESAKTTMNGAVIGLIILLTSYLLLTWINPGLVSLRIPALTSVKTLLLNQYCDTLNSSQYRVGAEPNANGKYKCNEDFPIVTLDGKPTGSTCKGRGCVNGAETCAWVGDNGGTFACQNPQQACESIINPRAQADCDLAADTSSGSGQTHVCRYADGDCEYKQILRGCQLLAEYLDQPDGVIVQASCAECLAGPEGGSAGNEIMGPRQCRSTGNFFNGNRLEGTGGNCIEPGSVGAVGVDAVCCRFGQDVNSFTKGSYDANELVCYMPFD